MHFTIGSFVLYRQSGSTLPLWPALLCPDDFAPQECLNTDPRTHVHLILIVGDKLTFRWALRSEIHHYDPFIPFSDEETVGNTPGLGEAYAMSNTAIEDGLGLEHWRRRIRNEVLASSSDSEVFYAEPCSDSSVGFDDTDMQMAIERSRLDFERVSKPKLLTPSPTPPKALKGASKVFITVDSDSDNDDDNDVRRQPSRTLYRPAFSTLRRPATPTRKDPRKPARDVPFKPSSSLEGFLGPRSQSSLTVPAVPESCQALLFAPKVFADGLNLKRLSKASNAPRSDIVVGDIEASKTHVRVRVGQDQEQHLLVKARVWDRPYFREANAGIMYFSMDDDDMFELKHPGLANVVPDDFAYIAEYLESDQFGHVNPQGVDQENEAFSQIVAAWTVAEQLGMTDLMDHIIDKLERLAPWDLWHVMLFACTVYGSSGLLLPVQDRIKEVLARNIAENYFVFIEDDHLSVDFIQRLKDLPELDRDVTVERAAILDGRLRQDLDRADGRR
ncbi:hypothetical protein T440DRAFT_22080 [Plenodomus tracheiphilus IPT5]|uniref:Uncharacterized protein n=1 Tax=Plenodomus tracheiphilus IPT5 TaxID=1408161 RepID=A0A6A7BER5_9PLEO|nr:hypothetical protein T440DRAFT_22080 [Plenodomus tracheiphilus IPT5]